MKIKQTPYSNIIALLCNILLAFAVYMVCRVAYVWENWNIFKGGWESLHLAKLVAGGLRFDASAIAYTNVLWAILLLLPILRKEKNWWQKTCKWLFVVAGSLAVAVNLCDAVYSQYTGRRTTATFFSEFSNEGNLASIFFNELINHWYLLLLALALIAALWFLYVIPTTMEHGKRSRKQGCLRTNQNENENNSTIQQFNNQQFNKKYFLAQSIALFLLIPTFVIATRGGVPGIVLKPIRIIDANRYVNQPHEGAIILNTPFSVIRTIGKTSYSDPKYFDANQMNALYSPVHNQNENQNHSQFTIHNSQKNIVILIVESFGREYIGFYNRPPFTNQNQNQNQNGQPISAGRHQSSNQSLTPFLDSLLSLSLTWEQTYANGRKSIDAMPAILSSIPMFVEPFVVTSYSLNHVGGLAYELGRIGYSSAFFHGASNGSMSFDNFAHISKFQHYYGRTEYDADKRFDGEKDYDGYWAIWDEPFLQYYATVMSDMQEPFITAVFTASSHHPFNIPQQYRSIYPEGDLPIHKCVRYTDNALRHFFATASQQPWFKNTIFVFSADHTNMSNHVEYQTPMGVFSAPIFIYDPSGQLPTGILPGIAQQIDIMPTILGILGYDKPYIAFGKDLLSDALRESTPSNSPFTVPRGFPARTSSNQTIKQSSIHNPQSWAINYNNGIYQYLAGDTLIQFDGNNTSHAFDLRNDPFLKHPLDHTPTHHLNRLKAIIQQYMQRMIGDKLVLSDDV